MKFNIDKIKVGKRIFNIRNSLNLTLEQFGKLDNLKASKSIVLRWENGTSLPNRSRLETIAKLGNMTVNELLFGSIDEFIDNNLATIHEYQTGKDHFSSMEEYTDNRLFLSMWIEDRNITLENIHYIYDYIDQNNASWNPWSVDADYLKTMENIRINMQDGTYSLVPLIEMLTEKDRKQLIKKVISKLKTYQLSDSDKKFIQSIEEGYDRELKNEMENGK